MKRILRTPLLFFASLVVIVNSALAGNPTVTVGVGAVPDVVSVSRSTAAYVPGAQLPPGVFLAAYNVKISNGSKNNINNFWFEANTVVSPTGSPIAPFVQAIGPVSCSTTDPTSQSYIRCPIGTIRSNQEVSFTVVYRSPAGGAQITFKSLSHYGEGTKDNPINSSHLDGTPGADVVTTLTTATSDLIKPEVKTFVPPGGAQSFTGITGIPTSNDPWTTTIIVPPLPPSIAYTTSTVDETPTTPGATCINCSSVLTTRLAIPDNAPGTLVFQGVAGNPDSGWLKIVLRRDASTLSTLGSDGIPTIVDYATARIFYLADGASSYVELYSCAVGYPTAGTPCVLSRSKYPNDHPVIDLRGDAEFLILARENGRTQM